jgi:hypothetical protein
VETQGQSRLRGDLIRTPVCATERCSRARRIALAAAGALALQLSSGCSPRETRLTGVILGEGEAAGSSCRAAALDLRTFPGSNLTLKRNATYTAEVSLELGDHPENCIYQIVGTTWLFDGLPHEFKCMTAAARLLTPFSTTHDPNTHYMGPDSLTVRVTEHNGATRHLVAEHFSREFAIAWR